MKKHGESSSTNRDLTAECHSPATRHHDVVGGTQPNDVQSQSTAHLNTAQPQYVRTGAGANNDANNGVTNSRIDGGVPLLPTPGSSVVTGARTEALEGTTHNNGLDIAYAEADTTWLPDQMTSGADIYMGAAQSNENFAAWLFDSPGSQQQEFNLTNLPFVDFGMGYSPTEMWNFDSVQPEISSSTAQDGRSPVFPEKVPIDLPNLDSHIRVSELRREQISSTLSSFWSKNRHSSCDVSLSRDSVLYTTGVNKWPNLTIQVLEHCLIAYWRDVAKQMPIIHQPTFSCDTSHLLVLLAVVALGASQLVRLSAKDSLRDYKTFADLIAINLRWEIFTDDDAQPPVQLWVAQALLLLELYEKMYTTRRLHERSHIHHASTLTLLRRGSPLIGHTGSETPPSALPTRNTTPVEGAESVRPLRETEPMRWWRRWAQNESMHRVVFAAFQMDALHAVMFGHDSALFPYEIRLPLPRDDALWAAQSAEEVKRLEHTFTMHGIKPINFLDGLKKCLHGHEVQSHHHARLILVAGLFSVGWHINRREKHLQFLETVPRPNEQERWKSLLLNAYGHWRRSFEDAIGHSKARLAGSRSASDHFADPTVLYHLAHITMHSDIIDLQVFAGYKRLLGRKVTARDQASVAHRMTGWVGTATARLAVLHSFKLLNETLSNSGDPTPQVSYTGEASIHYSCRADPFIYRPWALYLAALTIWAFQYASMLRSSSNTRPSMMGDIVDAEMTASRYIANCAAMNPDRLFILASPQGCTAMLRVLSDIFSYAESELLLEASTRLRDCAHMLLGRPP